MAKWALELRENEIDFKPQRSIKAHVLENFITETISNTEITIVEESNKKDKKENQLDIDE